MTTTIPATRPIITTEHVRDLRESAARAGRDCVLIAWLEGPESTDLRIPGPDDIITYTAHQLRDPLDGNSSLPRVQFASSRDLSRYASDETAARAFAARAAQQIADAMTEERLCRK